MLIFLGIVSSSSSSRQGRVYRSMKGSSKGKGRGRVTDTARGSGSDSYRGGVEVRK